MSSWQKYFCCRVGIKELLLFRMEKPHLFSSWSVPDNPRLESPKDSVVLRNYKAENGKLDFHLLGTLFTGK